VPTTAAEQLAAFTASLEYDDLPERVVDAIKLHLLDTLGCAAAASALGVADHVYALIEGQSGAAVAIGHPKPVPPHLAALVNGTLAHALDFDDTHSRSICHVSVTVVSAALAQAAKVHASGRELIAALAAGNETVTRIGAACAPLYMQTGFHPTSVCGVFGAATAAARLSRLPILDTTHALGISGSLASGLFEYLADGTTTKALHAGWAAHGGVCAASLAAAGATGPATVLEGRFGFFASYYREGEGAHALERELESLGREWETAQIAFKPYPACHFIHACLDAAAAATGGQRLAAKDVDELVVLVPAPAVPLVLEPREDKITPRSDYDGKFSLQFSLAAMLSAGTVNLQTYATETIHDPSVLELAAKVRYEVVDFATFPGAFPGGVRIHTRAGAVLTETLPYQRGSAENPMSPDQVREKYRANAGLALDASSVAALEDAVLDLEDRATLNDVLQPLRRTIAHQFAGAPA
jgi:2-methylcitrate dehydratase PrpD